MEKMRGLRVPLRVQFLLQLPTESIGREEVDTTRVVVQHKMIGEHALIACDPKEWVLFTWGRVTS